MFPRHFPSLKIPDREATTREGQLIPKMASVGEERGPLASEDEVDSEEEAELEEEHRQAKEVSRGKKKRKAKRKVSGTSTPPRPFLAASSQIRPGWQALWTLPPALGARRHGGFLIPKPRPVG